MFDEKGDAMIKAQPIPTTAFENLVAAGAVTPKTLEVLRDRIAKHANPSPPSFFSADEFRCLVAVADVILAEIESGHAEAAAAFIDCRLCDQEGKGWRYDELPPETEMYRVGLARIDSYAKDRSGKLFAGHSRDERSLMVKELFEREGCEPALDLFWEEALVDVIESHYSHPAVQLRIRAYGMADVKPPISGVTEV